MVRKINASKLKIQPKQLIVFSLVHIQIPMFITHNSEEVIIRKITYQQK